jgi:hypothetical protein
MRNELYYIVPFLAYVFSFVLSDAFNLNYYVGYSLRAVLTFALLVYFWKSYKVSFRLDIRAVLWGLAIAVVWLLLENQFISVEPSEFNPFALPNLSFVLVLVKVFSMVIVAPAIEELFTRSFLIRFFISADKWEKVRIGKFTLVSFISTVVFFGFMHSRWLQGIVSGVMFTFVLYRTKRIDSCIQAHAIANLALALVAVFSQNWYLW